VKAISDKYWCRRGAKRRDVGTDHDTAPGSGKVRRSGAVLFSGAPQRSFR